MSQLRESTTPKAPSTPARYLIPVAGPPMEPVELVPKPAGIIIGRHGDCDVLLPADADRVSRFHARIDCRDGTWSLTDLDSRWGTSVDGVKLTGNVGVPLDEGDLVRITPFTFVFSATPRPRGMVASRDDTASHTMVRTIGGDQATGIIDGMLELLLVSAQQVHQATDERTLAERLMDAALRGTGLSNAAFLRALDQSGHYEIVASRFANATAGEPARFSQSLIQAASTGQAAELMSSGQVSQSIVQMGIASALCVPLVIGQGDIDGDGRDDSTIAAYLYLDSRGMLSPQLRPQAREFCVALGRMASMSLANIKRMEIERRQAKLESELKNAASVQTWMLPQRNTQIGSLTCIGESRFGQYLGGDFFDLIDIGDDKVCVTIGDVCGKGITASVLMTAMLGYLHASLRATRDPAQAVTAAHAFIVPRKPVGKFITMWIGVIDLRARTLRYVDAGHGYALLQQPDGTCALLEAAGGPPVGMIDEATYEAAEVPMPEGARLLLMSDGIIEQFGAVKGADGTTTREQFEVAGVLRCLQSNRGEPDPVNCLFDTLIKHAGTTSLSDDATIVWVKS